MALVLGVPFVMRDVTLWAFTDAFFEELGEDLAEFETAMRYMDQPRFPETATIGRTCRISAEGGCTVVTASAHDVTCPPERSQARGSKAW